MAFFLVTVTVTSYNILAKYGIQLLFDVVCHGRFSEL